MAMRSAALAAAAAQRQAIPTEVCGASRHVAGPGCSPDLAFEGKPQFDSRTATAGAAAAGAGVLAGRRKARQRASERRRVASLAARSESADRGPPAGQAPSEDTVFGFDAGLVSRFLEIAEPYFVPEGGFGPLLVGLLFGVVGATFFLFLAGLKVVALSPVLAALVPAPGAEAKLTELMAPTYVGAAGAAVSVCALVFASRREDLAGREKQWAFLGLLVFLLICVTGINVVISYVFRSIDNVLVAKNEPGFYTQMQLFVAVLVFAVPTIALYKFVRLTLARSWREFLTVLILGKYFQDRNYYMLDSNSTDTNIDNPDQRISEDIQHFTSETLGFLLDLLGSLSNLISFAAILWATSEQLTYALVVYALLGTVIALAVGGELIGINYKQLRLQADFRYSLVHVRDNAEAIAFYQGEAREQDGVVAKLQAALQNYDKVIKWTTGLTLYQKAFFYIARLVPYFVVGGLYFAGKVDFGTFGQVSFAFSMVLSSVTLIVTRIQDISRFSAGVNRLGTFYEAISEAEHVLPQTAGSLSDRISTLTTHGESSSEIALDGITLWTPTGRVLVEDMSIRLAAPTPTFQSGGMDLPSRLLVVGSSGVGKSSILRAVAGLWTQGKGTIQRPDIGEMLFLPQKPYMPLGDLRTQLLYPLEAAESDVGDADLVEVLGRFGLGDLPGRFPDGLDTVADWTRVLSLGEQQRLAAARCLISNPRVAVLDEATSALPVPDERNLYLCLKERNIAYVSVGHRPSLVEHHDLILELQGQGRWRIMTPKEYEDSLVAAVGAGSDVAAGGIVPEIAPAR